MWASLSCMRCCCCCWRGGGTATATAHKLTNFCSLSSCVAEGSLQSLFSWCESSRGIGDSLDWRCEGEISIRIFRLISQLARSGPASDGWWRWRGGADGERQLQPVSWCSCSDLVTAGPTSRASHTTCSQLYPTAWWVIIFRFQWNNKKNVSHKYPGVCLKWFLFHLSTSCPVDERMIVIICFSLRIRSAL